MPFLQYRGDRLYFECHGDGDSLLFLHGWNGSMAGFKANLLSQLKKTRQVVLLDLPGCGHSDPFSATFDDLSRIVDSVLEELGLTSVTLAGFCLGGAVALDFSLRQPDRVKAVYLVETSLGFPAILQPLRLPHLGPRLLEFGLRSRLGSWLSLRYLLRPGFPYRKEFLKSFAAIDLETSLHLLLVARSYSRQDHYSRIRSELKCPITVVNGAYPSASVKATTRRLLQTIPEARLFIVPGAGHFIIEERPELLSRILAGESPLAESPPERVESKHWARSIPPSFRKLVRRPS